MSSASTSVLLRQARILTPGSQDATSIAVEHGAVTWVGQDRPGPTLFPDATHIDCGNAWIAPPFVAASSPETEQHQIDDAAAAGVVLVSDTSPALSLDDARDWLTSQHNHTGVLRVVVPAEHDTAIADFIAVCTEAADVLGSPKVAALSPSIQGLTPHALVTMTPAQREQLARIGAALIIEPLASEGSLDGVDLIELAAAGITLAISPRDSAGEYRPWDAVAAAAGARSVTGIGRGLSPRAAFTAATRGAARTLLGQSSVMGVLQPGVPASFAAWDTGELVSVSADDAVQRWSTDPRSGVPPMPDLEADNPRCLAVLLNGVSVFDDGFFGTVFPTGQQ